MYSQRDEEKHIVEFFTGKIGRFLDIGAADGKTFSNTLRLAELGWAGVLVEPNPANFVGLLRNVGENPKMTLVNAALGLESGLSSFYACDDLVSTLSEDHKALWQANAKFREIMTHVLDIDEFFRALPGPYNFVNLDVEGTNYSLLQRIPLQNLGVEMLCVEFEDRRRAVLKLMTVDRPWKLLHETAENFLFVRRPL